MSKKGKWIPRDEKYADDRVMITCTGYIADTKTDDVFLSVQALINKYNEILKENEQFKKALRIVYSTKLTEPTKHTIEQIAKVCGIDLE